MQISTFHSRSQQMPGSTHLEASPQVLEQSRNFKWEALNNDLVWSHIAQHLTHNELKKAMLVSKNFCRRIRDSKYFQDSSVVRLSGLDFRKKQFEAYNECTFIWKSVEIDIDPILDTFEFQNMPDLCQRFKCTESLKLFRFKSVCKMYCPLLRVMLAGMARPSARLSPYRLKSLTLNYALLYQADLQNILNDPLVQSVLQNLDALHFTEQRNSGHSGYNPDNFTMDSVSIITSNVLKLASLSTELKNFSWEKPGNPYIDDRHELPVAFVHSNSRTITTLHLHFGYNPPEYGIRFECPNLRYLKIYTWPSFDEENIFLRFLEKLPPLITLDLEYDGFQCVDELLGSVARVHGHSLKKLRFNYRHSKLNCTMYCQFSKMSQLEAFDIQVRSCDRDYFGMPRILTALPKTVNVLALHGVYHGGWNRTCEHVCVNCPTYCDCDPQCGCVQSPPAEIALLLGFVNLTELTIVSPGGQDSVLDNQMLFSITENLRKLKILRFSHCYKLTDIGLTGRLPDGLRIGTAINKGLRDLRELLIKDCPLLTKNALLSTIKFRHLTSLYLVTREWGEPEKDPTPGQTLARVAEQNPCLTSMTVHSHVEDIGTTLKAANPSLVNVMNAHTWDCGYDVGFYDPFQSTSYFKGDVQDRRLRESLKRKDIFI